MRLGFRVSLNAKLGKTSAFYVLYNGEPIIGHFVAIDARVTTLQNVETADSVGQSDGNTVKVI